MCRKNVLKRSFTLLLAMLIVITGLSVNVLADDELVNTAEERTTLGVDLVMGETENSPLSLDIDKKVFYFAPNIGPGDVLKSEIVFTNSENVAVQIAVTDVIDNQNGRFDELLDISTLTVSLDGSPIYKGPHSQITRPVTNWIMIKPGEEITLDIEVDIPKTLDNRFQGAQMDVSWVVETRSSTLNDVNVLIIYKDEDGKTIRRVNKTFGYDYLVTSKDLDPINGYTIVDFKPVKAVSDNQEIEVVMRRADALYSVNFIYKDENGELIDTRVKRFPFNHLISAGDIDRPEGYHVLTFEQIRVTKDSDVNVVVRRGPASGIPEGINPENVETGDNLNFYPFLLTGFGVLIAGYFLYHERKRK